MNQTQGREIAIGGNSLPKFITHKSFACMVPFPGTFSLDSYGNRVWNNKIKADELQSKEVYTNIYYNLTEYAAML